MNTTIVYVEMCICFWKTDCCQPMVFINIFSSSRLDTINSNSFLRQSYTLCEAGLFSHSPLARLFCFSHHFIARIGINCYKACSISFPLGSYSTFFHDFSRVVNNFCPVFSQYLPKSIASTRGGAA